MQFLVLLASAVPALASAVLPRQAPDAFPPEDYTFEVTHWSAGCQRGGCSYDHKVTGMKTDKIPGFYAYCFGGDVGHFSPCEIWSADETATSGPPSVAVSLLERVDHQAEAKMNVSLAWVDTETKISTNISGGHVATFNRDDAPEYDFFVKPEVVVQVL